MDSPINEINRIRNDWKCVLRSNEFLNRYMLEIDNKDLTTTSYVFSVPIFNITDGNLVNLKFSQENGCLHHTGSNADIIVRNNVVCLKNSCGIVHIEISKSEKEIGSNNMSMVNLSPTLNGVKLRKVINKEKFIKLNIDINETPYGIKFNEKYFSFMSHDITPIFTISVIGDRYIESFTPGSVVLNTKAIDDRHYQIYIECSDELKTVEVECNMYEQKLMLDTTVENRRPDENNLYGASAIIGSGEKYGEQWLFSKINYGIIRNILLKRIKSVRLFIPRLNKKVTEITAYNLMRRFCSIGTTWNNNDSRSTNTAKTVLTDSYYIIDITGFTVDSETQNFIEMLGFVLKPKCDGNSYSLISTGDCYDQPQILEITYYN